MTPENIASLQELMQADPALAEQLQSATTTEAAAQLLAQAASQQGIAVEAGAIADLLATAQVVQMSDSELDAVAGGLIKNSGFIALTYLTGGFGCVFYSLARPGASITKCQTK